REGGIVRCTFPRAAASGIRQELIGAMRLQTPSALITALCALSVASGQTGAQETLDRVFGFSHTETEREFQDVGEVIRAMTDIRQASPDAAHKSLALRGTAVQIALAEWLFNQLDQPVNRPVQQNQNLAVHEYRLSGGGEAVVRIFYTNSPTPRDLQEVAA